MGTEIWVNISSGNGFLPDGTKPLPEPMLTDHQWSPVTFILGQFHNRRSNHHSLKSVWNGMSQISFKFPRDQWVKGKIMNPQIYSYLRCQSHESVKSVPWTCRMPEDYKYSFSQLLVCKLCPLKSTIVQQIHWPCPGRRDSPLGQDLARTSQDLTQIMTTHACVFWRHATCAAHILIWYPP